MVYALPVVGWFFGWLFTTFLAIPFYFVWNHVAPVYFWRFLPEEYLYLPFWDIVWLIMCISMLKAILLPRFASTTTNTGKK